MENDGNILLYDIYKLMLWGYVYIYIYIMANGNTMRMHIYIFVYIYIYIHVFTMYIDTYMWVCIGISLEKC